MTMTATTLPPSSVAILRALDYRVEISHKDLVSMTRLNPRTVRWGIKKLKERRLVIVKLNMHDLRQIMYLKRVPTESSNVVSPLKGIAGS